MPATQALQGTPRPPYPQGWSSPAWSPRECQSRHHRYFRWTPEGLLPVLQVSSLLATTFFWIFFCPPPHWSFFVVWLPHKMESPFDHCIPRRSADNQGAVGRRRMVQLVPVGLATSPWLTVWRRFPVVPLRSPGPTAPALALPATTPFPGAAAQSYKLTDWCVG